ncbi:MAG: hypothetical protein ACRCXT_08105 [Paraclostridium sp.]
MEENQVRATVAPAPIPNAENMVLLDACPTLSLKIQENDLDTGKSKIVTRNFEWLNPKADAKKIYTFAEKVEALTVNDGLMDVIVVNKTSINL